MKWSMFIKMPFITKAKERLLKFNTEYRESRKVLFKQVEQDFAKGIWKDRIDMSTAPMNAEFVNRLASDLRNELVNQGYTVKDVHADEFQIYFEVDPLMKDVAIPLRADPQPIQQVTYIRHDTSSCSVM